MSKVLCEMEVIHKRSAPMRVDTKNKKFSASVCRFTDLQGKL